MDKDTQNAAAILHGADIIISGAGSPHFIKPDMVKEGAVLIDAGTSEHGGKLTGDIDPLARKKHRFLLPCRAASAPSQSPFFSATSCARDITHQTRAY